MIFYYYLSKFNNLYCETHVKRFLRNSYIFEISKRSSLSAPNSSELALNGPNIFPESIVKKKILNVEN